MGQFLFQTYHLNTMWLTTLRMIFAGIILLSVCFIKDTKKTLSIWNNKNDVFQLILFVTIRINVLFNIPIWQQSIIQTVQPQLYYNTWIQSLLCSIHVLFVKDFLIKKNFFVYFSFWWNLHPSNTWKYSWNDLIFWRIVLGSDGRIGCFVLFIASSTYHE